MEVWQYALALVGGAFAGAINTLAGNGSTITLTILTEVMGLPGNVANGTNRLGIFSQTLAGSWVFYRNGRLDLRRTWPFILLTTLGSVFGVLVAISISDEQFRDAFRYLMVVMLVVILVKPERWLRETDLDQKINWTWAAPLFLAIGFYGGFIQMGMGLFFLAAMVLGARFSLTDANAVKSLVIAVYTLLVILIFQWSGMIDWKMGLILAIGQSLGGWATAQYASRSDQANKWAYRVLVAVILLAVARLFWQG